MNNGVMDIFVLEDSSERIKWFQKTFGDCNIVFTKNVKDACDDLRTKDYDLIFLDRDLGFSKKTGDIVAKVMRDEKISIDACIVLHSVNPYGQEMMNRYLKYHNNVHCISFPQLRKMKREDF